MQVNYGPRPHTRDRRAVAFHKTRLCASTRRLRMALSFSGRVWRIRLVPACMIWGISVVNPAVSSKSGKRLTNGFL